MRAALVAASLALLAPTTAAALEADGPREVGRYGVWELTLTQPEAAATGNVWTEYYPRIEVTTPAGRVLTFDGFYYDADTWKVRFSPMEPGRHTYRVTLGSDRAEGAFEVFASGRQGFLRRHPSNPYRLTFEADESLFPAFGFGGCLAPNPEAPRLAPGVDPNDVAFWIDGAGGFDQEVYIERTLLAAGANLYRWSVANCSFAPWDAIVDGRRDRYSVMRGKWGDDWVRALRRHGIRVMMDVLGFGWDEARTGPDSFAAIAPVEARAELGRAYVRYIVARYGAYVDIWELINEFSPSDDWVREMVALVHRVDPYRQDAACQRPVGQRRCRHPISVSWSRPAIAEIEISAPHHYFDSNRGDEDVGVARGLIDGIASEPHARPLASHEKPVIIAEAGEASAGPRAAAAVGSRIKAWSAFFHQSAILFWEFGYIDRDGSTPGFVLSLDDATRASLRGQRDFMDQVEADARPPRGVPGPGEESHRVVGSGVRVYDLRGATSTYAYLVDPGCASERTVRNLAFEVDFAAAGTARWYEPATGRFTGAFAVPRAGRREVRAPDFRCDLALVAKPAFAPVVRAGPDQRVWVDAAGAVTLAGTVLDVDTEAVDARWEVVHGAATLAAPDALRTTARFEGPGRHVLALVANDGTHEACDTVTVVVAAEAEVEADAVPPTLTRTVVAVVLQLEGDLASVTVDGEPRAPDPQGALRLEVDVTAGARTFELEVEGVDGTRVRRRVTVDPEEVGR